MRSSPDKFESADLLPRPTVLREIRRATLPRHRVPLQVLQSVAIDPQRIHPSHSQRDHPHISRQCDAANQRATLIEHIRYWYMIVGRALPEYPRVTIRCG